MGLNKNYLQGRTTTEIEVKKTQTGLSVANFTLAVDDYNSTDFVPCKVWREKAEQMGQNVRKGTMIIIEGKTKTYTEEKDGKKNTKTYVQVIEYHYCGSKPKEETKEEPPKEEVKAEPPKEEEHFEVLNPGEELPF